ncbi:MAG: tetratricopeptide repeat protein [Vicinamibacterales bacterium]
MTSSVSHFGRIVAVTLISVGVCASALAQTGRAFGRVLDGTTGKPIRGASVTAESPQAALSSMSVISDDKGRFAMIGLRSGAWMMTASAPGYELQSGMITIRAAGSDPVEFKLVKLPAVSVSPLVGLDLKAVADELQSAQNLLEQQRLDESIAAYRAILKKLPVLSAAHLQIARAYRLKRDYDAALQAYDAIPPSDPRHGLAMVERGLTEMERGRIDAAEQILSEAAAAESAGPETYFSLGEVKRARGAAADAATWYKKATEADPGWARPYVKLGLLAVEQGDRAAARTYLERAIVLQPQGADADEARTLLNRTAN